jgi:2-desacetyl-2-hydroxyethyl bacteriochlorophyllide A dehydrogenase
MKAAFYEKNKTIRLGEPEAADPGKGQVQIQVHSCGICGTDVGIYHGKMDWRVAPSQIMGHEMSGTISALGEGVEGWEVGDPVTVMPLDPCGDCANCRAGLEHICENLNFLGIDSPGAFQQTWNVPAHTVYRLPESLPLELGALIEPLAVACHDARLADLRPGQQAVVIGGGPIGALIALVAREAGARVTVAEINPHRIQRLQGLGLECLDPRETDLTKLLKERTGGAGADTVFEVTGHPDGAKLATELPKARGLIVIVGIFAQPVPFALFPFFWKELRMRGARVYERQDFQRAIDLASTGNLPLDELVTSRLPLENLGEGLDLMTAGGDTLKILINCQ